MRYIFLILIIFMTTTCNNTQKSEDEIQAMNTVCIDGVLNLSVLNGFDCMYIPIMDDNYEMMRCKK